MFLTRWLLPIFHTLGRSHRRSSLKRAYLRFGVILGGIVEFDEVVKKLNSKDHPPHLNREFSRF